MEDMQLQLKHIIWIEDFDNKDPRIDQIPSSPEEWDSEEDISENNHDDDIISTFGKYSPNVILFVDAIKALEHIDKHFSIVDCIILDINMQQTLADEKVTEFKKLCEEKDIFVGESTDKDIIQNCGYYIFLYLLKSGFPANNIIMFTGNEGENNITGDWKKRFQNAGLNPPKSIGKSDGKNELIEEIDKIYQNAYYRTRLIVIKACEFWKNKLLDELKNKEDISFNKIYYNDIDMIEAPLFVNMLERIEMLFPINVPSNKGKIYFQAMQVVCMFHEESAKIDKIKDRNEIWIYHQAIRSFRNWSAHNKFLNDFLEDDVFLYLFLVSLRTYFGDDIELPELYYEVSEFEDKDIDSEKFKEKYIESFGKHFEKVKDSQPIEKNKKIWECKDVHSILLASGNCKEKNMCIKDLFFHIMEKHLNIKTEFFTKNNSLGVTVTIEPEWNDVISNLNNSNRFRKRAYILFMQQEN